MTLKQTQTILAAVWRNSDDICAYADGDRHLGHILRAGDGWVAVDATHTTVEGNSFQSLGFFHSIEAARKAVEAATSPRFDAASGLSGWNLV